MNYQYDLKNLDLSVYKNRIHICNELALVCKFPVENDTNAQATVVAGVSGVVLNIAASAGWSRLVASTHRPDSAPALLAVRLLLSVERDEPVPLQFRPKLATVDATTRQHTIHSETTINLRDGQTNIYAMRGVFVCGPASDAKRLDFFLDLPQGGRISILSVDMAWHDAEISAAAAARIATAKSEIVVPFSLTPVTAAQLMAEMALPAPVQQTLEFKGFDLIGRVVGLAPVTRLRAASSAIGIDVTADERVEIAEGVCLPCGFRVPLLDLVNEETTALTLSDVNRADQPFATVEIPAPLLQALRASRGMAARPKDLPPADKSDLYFYPDYSATNPYQRLMYRNMPQVVARSGTVLDAISRLEAGAARGAVTLHLHWLNPLLAGVTTAAEAEAKRQEFKGLLRHFIRLGGIVMWTVHNTVSHDSQFHEAETGLMQDVADLAHVIHVHSETLLPTLADFYDLPPGKLVIQPHPNYIGSYADYVTRDTARHRLGLPKDAKVILFVGQLRPYKGIEHLAHAFGRVADAHPDAYLLIAGKPVHPYVPGTLTRTVQLYRNVRVIEGFIPDDDLQWYYRACDWVALPYASILTSGSLLCALSFSRPCIAPQMGMIGDVITHGRNGLLYDPQDIDGLAVAIETALQTGPEDQTRLQAAAYDSVAPLTWQKMGAGLEEACARARKTRRLRLPFDDGPRECLILGPEFPPPAPARTAIVILNYEHVDDVQRLVGTLRASKNQDFDIYIVDNASPGTSPEELMLDLPDLRLLCLPENLGYAAGNNAALRMIADLPYEFVWILNPDMVVSADALEQHIAAATAHPSHAIFGPVILRGANDRQVASAGCYVRFNDGLATGHMYAGENCATLPADPFEVDFITGASVFLRKTVLEKIGLLPEDYFLYFEETHWLLAARDKGFRSLVLPQVRLAHYKRSEEDGLPAKYYFYYYIRNALLFYSRMTRNDAGLQRERLVAGFIATWLKKIKARRPDMLEVYRHLAEAALADGLAGKAGRVDLFEMAFALQSHAPAFDCSDVMSSFSVEPDGTVTGLITTLGLNLGTVVVSIFADGAHAGDFSITPADRDHGVQAWSMTAKLPSGCHRDRSVTLEFRLNGRPLPSGKIMTFLPRLEPDYQGRLDGIANYVCSGWALDKNSTDQKVTVEILYDGNVIARAVADQFRADLQRANVGDAAAAFQVRMPRMFSDGRKRKITLRVAGSDQILSNRELSDTLISGGADPLPIGQMLDDLFYGRHLWLARHDLEDLPLGKVLALSLAALSAQHADRPETELVSVIMPAFNRADTIVSALASVRAQTYQNWELLVVDDCSSDGTAEVVENFIATTGDSRITLITLKENRGVSAARNAGLHAAKGDVIAYLDSDNTWLPDFARIMTGALMCQPTPGSAYCGQRIVQICGLPDAPVEELIALRMAPFHLPLLENRNYIDLNCFVHHRRLYESLGGFAEPLRRLVDWELILRYARAETPHFVPALLSNYYFDRAANQITKLESFDDNLLTFIELADRHAKRAIPDLTLRPVDIALMATAGQSVALLAQRAAEISATLGQVADVAFLLCPDPAGVTGVTAPLAAHMTVVHPDRPGSGMLAAVLAARRTDADLVMIAANAMPQPGWLAHFNAAVTSCPQGGLFVSRQMIMGRQVSAHAKAVPFAHAARDACIALPANRRIVVDPALNPAMNLVELSEAGLFCSYLTADCARMLRLEPMTDPDPNQQLQMVSQLLPLLLGRKIIYCGNVEVYDL